MARSTDGFTFTDLGSVLARGASAPTLVSPRENELWVLFDDAGDSPESKGTRLAITKSRDTGRTWSRIEPVRVVDRRGQRERLVLDARNASLVREADGHLRMLFVAGPESKELVLSAIWKERADEFQVDKGVRLRVPPHGFANPAAVSLRQRLHIYTSVSAMDNRQGSDGGPEPDVEPSLEDGGGWMADHFLAIADRKISRLAPVESPAPAGWSSLLNLGGEVRAYFAKDGRISVAHSFDTRLWSPSKKFRGPNGWDPAVVQLQNGSFFMVYAVPAESVPTDATALANERSERWAEQAEAVSIHTNNANETDDAPGAADSDLAEGDTEGEAVRDDVDEDGPFSDSNPEDESEIGDDRETEEWLAPVPDFVTTTNYVEWYRLTAGEVEGGNAYDLYMNISRDAGPNDENWPAKILDMNNDGEYDGPPGPWNLDDHPDWADSEKRMAPWLDRFREATRQDEYVHSFDVGELALTPDGVPLLMNLTLAHLPKHRTLAKAVLADGWKQIDGKLPPERLVAAWETVLRGADHLENGTTLIEQLVGHAERNLVYRDARWALQHGALTSPGQLREAIDLLENYAQGPSDTARVIRGEHACAMDLTQYVFSPPNERGEPQVNLERAKYVANSVSESEFPEDLADLTPEQIRGELRNIDSFYNELGEQFRIGYPDVRAADLNATAERYQRSGSWSSVLLPALSRVAQIKTRTEATSRATRLVYHTHLFKAQTGRWPRSVDELGLPAESNLRTDPFTGRDFGYRLTDRGPRIYSMSENARDDGGEHHARWGDSQEPDASDDFVFWPPQHVP